MFTDIFNAVNSSCRKLNSVGNCVNIIIFHLVPLVRQFHDKIFILIERTTVQKNWFHTENDDFVNYSGGEASL